MSVSYTHLDVYKRQGYYSRVRNLQKAAQIMVSQYGGSFPTSFQELRKLPGIGDYTAGAVASIALGLPYPAVDGNVLRVLSRLLASRADIADPRVKKDCFQALAETMPRDCPGDFDQALMELGACVCLPGGEPLCGACPLAHLCRGRGAGIQAQLPVKAPKKAVRVEEHTVLVLRRQGPRGEELPLLRRPEKGLLGGLWQPPMLPGSPSREEVERTLADGGFQVGSLAPLPDARHLFTHIRWELHGWSARVSGEGPGDWRWSTVQEIRQGSAVPSAFEAYLGPKVL